MAGEPDVGKRLPVGISIATLCSAFIAVGMLWTKVDLLADDHVSQEAVENIKDDLIEINESISKVEEDVNTNTETLHQNQLIMIKNQTMLEQLVERGDQQ